MQVAVPIETAIFTPQGSVFLAITLADIARNGYSTHFFASLSQGSFDSESCGLY